MATTCILIKLFSLPKVEQNTVSSVKYQLKHLICSSLNTRIALSSLWCLQYKEYIQNETKWHKSRITFLILLMHTPGNNTWWMFSYYYMLQAFWAKSLAPRLKMITIKRGLHLRDIKSLISPLSHMLTFWGMCEIKIFISVLQRLTHIPQQISISRKENGQKCQLS